ncbi:hypothetical protein K435DRAFT_922387, partial [Dendrothele bispora CBS 962.96]
GSFPLVNSCALLSPGLSPYGDDQNTFKPNALVKKTITVMVNGSELHLVSYYASEDINSGKLKIALINSLSGGVGIIGIPTPDQAEFSGISRAYTVVYLIFLRPRVRPNASTSGRTRPVRPSKQRLSTNASNSKRWTHLSLWTHFKEFWTHLEKFWTQFEGFWTHSGRILDALKSSASKCVQCVQNVSKIFNELGCSLDALCRHFYHL